MTLTDVRKCIKAELPDVNVYIGRLGSSRENAVAVYDRQTNLNEIAIGGSSNTSCAVKGIKILIHGSQNAADTEKLAYRVYNIFYGRITADWWCNIRHDAPVSIGTDNSNIYEYVINVDIWYKRKE